MLIQLLLYQASKEFALENALKKMKKDWEGMFFSFVPYKETGVSILSAFDDIQVNHGAGSDRKLFL